MTVSGPPRYLELADEFGAAATRRAARRGLTLVGRGYGAGQAGVSNPPSPIVSGALPTSRGIRPVIGPMLVADAGVVSVRLAPSAATPRTAVE